MESRYGTADRIWVMASAVMPTGGWSRRPTSSSSRKATAATSWGRTRRLLRRYEKQLIASDWDKVHEGLEVKLCADPDGGAETFILCRSAARRQKEKAMHERFEKRIEEGLTSLVKLAEKRSMTAVAIVASRRPAAGPEHPRRRRVQDRDHNRCPGQRRAQMGEGRGVALLGEPQRRLLPAPQQRQQLDRGGTVACVHATDRSRGGVPNPQKRSVDASGLAPEETARAGPRAGLLPGLRACGKRWANCASRPAWATSREKCWMR